MDKALLHSIVYIRSLPSGVVDAKMIEILLIILAVGFVLYYLVRHPIKTIKYSVAFLGLLLLGVIGIIGTLTLLSMAFT